MSAHHALTELLSSLPLDPGNDFKPNSENIPKDVKDMFNKLLGFVVWTVTGLCVAGLMIVGAKMAISHQRGEAGQHATGVAWVGAACLLVGTASQIIGAFL